MAVWCACFAWLRELLSREPAVWILPSSGDRDRLSKAAKRALTAPGAVLRLIAWTVMPKSLRNWMHCTVAESLASLAVHRKDLTSKPRDWQGVLWYEGESEWWFCPRVGQSWLCACRIVLQGKSAPKPSSGNDHGQKRVTLTTFLRPYQTSTAGSSSYVNRGYL